MKTVADTFEVSRSNLIERLNAAEPERHLMASKTTRGCYR